MNLYLKILKFAKPYWKFIVLAVFMTFSYVLFNNISLWVSVDFIRELFSPQIIESNSTVTVEQQSEAEGVSKDDVLKVPAKLNFYKKINYTIKKILIQENQYDTLLIVCLVIFLSFLLKNISLYLKKIILVYIQLRVVKNIRDKLQNVLMHLPIPFFERQHSGKLSSIVFNDVTAVNNVLKDSFGSMLLTPIQVLSNLIILLLISWKLSLITLTIVPLSGLLIIKIGQSIRRKSRRVYQKISEVFTAFQEAVASIRIVKAFTSEMKEIEKFEKANFNYYKTQFRSNKLSLATSPLNETLGILILVALLWYGGNLVYSGSDLEAEDFIRYLLFLFAMFQPLKDMSGLNNAIQTGLAAAERIFSIIDSETEIYEKSNSIKLDTIHNSIEYDHVFFRYNHNEPVVLKDINLCVKKGETVAFVGHSGSGKTTLVNLLPRFYDVEHGSIKIDDIDIRDFSLRSLRKQMGIVTQDTILFNDTVRANIAYGMENGVTDEQIIEAAKAANAWEFIEKLENRLDTMIGEKGLKLSGGQKQRLSIARAILKNPPILILDEATSALDTESEKLVQEAIDKLMKNRTVLVIAHRLSTVIHADKIVVINGGKIVDVGPHRRLLKTCPIYRHLYEVQFRDEINENIKSESPESSA